MPADSFEERTDLLDAEVGRGHITASVTVDQVYAHYQHEHLEFKHPRGGEAQYLLRPLLARTTRYLNHISDHAITESGSNLSDAFRDVAENLSDRVEVHAPVEFGDLRRSGHPQVIDDNVIVYDRAPKQHRLSPEELKAKDDARRRHRR